MQQHMKCINTDPQDLETIIRLFDASVGYQEKNGYPTWRNYDKDAIINDIKNKLQFKVIADGEIAMVFSILYSDPIIWRHMDDGKSLYLHRIVVNPSFKGRRLFQVILDWAISNCREKRLNKVRMDTWAENPGIITYYKSFGFNEVERFTTPDSPNLPEHNRGLHLVLLERQGN